MAKATYAVIGTAAKKVKKQYAVIDGKTRKIKKVYTVVGGKTRLSWSGGIGFNFGYIQNNTSLIMVDPELNQVASVSSLYKGNAMTSIIPFSGKYYTSYADSSSGYGYLRYTTNFTAYTKGAQSKNPGATDGTYLYAMDNTYSSNGTNWSSVTGSYTINRMASGNQCVVFTSGDIYASTIYYRTSPTASPTATAITQCDAYTIKRHTNGTLTAICQSKGTGYIAYSINGGKDWSYAQVATDVPTGVSYWNSKIVYFKGNYYFFISYTSGTTTHVYKSDNLTTWSKLGTVSQRFASWSNVEGYEVYLPTDSKIWASINPTISGNGTAYYTTNGTTWTASSKTIGQNRFVIEGEEA